MPDPGLRAVTGGDVVVVGGGIVGCALAHQLTRTGAHVVLIERDELAAGASGRNHGLLATPLDPALVPMAARSLEAYRTFVPEAPIPVTLDPDPIGYLIVADSEAGQHEAGEFEARGAETCGVPVRRLSAEEVVRLEPGISPEVVAEGWLLEDMRRLQPAELTAALALAAAADGAQIRHHLTARTLLMEGTRVRGVVTDEGPIHAGTVVAAAGPWTGALVRPTGVELPVMAARGWLVGLRPPSPAFARILGRAGWHSPPDPEGLPPPKAGEVMEAPPPAALGTLLQPNTDGTVLVGGSRQLALADEPEDPDIPRRLLRAAIRMVPGLARARVLSSWWGLRPMTPDGRPMVGPVAEGLLVATGHGSLGVTLAGGTAELVASLVGGGEPPFDGSPFDPQRFDPWEADRPRP